MSDIIDNQIKDEDFHLPEERKTEKRLLELEDDDGDDERSNDDGNEGQQSHPSSDLLAPIEYSHLNHNDISHLQLQSPQMTSSGPFGVGTMQGHISSSYMTTTTSTQSFNSLNNLNNSNNQLPTTKMTTPSPRPSPSVTSTNNNNGGGILTTTTTTTAEIESDSEYFSGRRVIAESGSDISGGEADAPSAPLRKKKKSMRKEGKIYELLEQRLGSDSLRQAILNPNTPFDWPFELVLVRHGQSEGNEAQARSKRGDLSAYTAEFKKKHSSTYRLTDKGIRQAKIAGKWVRENVAEVFDRYYTSEYVRAMETASLLGLQDARWLTEIQLRERDKGKMDNISWTEKNERFSHEMELRKRDSFFWAPPGGESIAQICSRVEHTFTTLRRECANKRVVIVAHGEIMWAFRVRLERLSQIRFHQLQSSKDPRDQIHNTSILWYTRVHPKTGEVFPYFKFLRSVCPWKPEYSAPGWQMFDRPVYSNEELMSSVRTVPRFVNNMDN